MYELLTSCPYQTPSTEYHQYYLENVKIMNSRNSLRHHFTSPCRRSNITILKISGILSKDAPAHRMQAYAGQEEELYASLTLAPDGGDLSHSRPGRLTQRYHSTGSQVFPQSLTGHSEEQINPSSLSGNRTTIPRHPVPQPRHYTD